MRLPSVLEMRQHFGVELVGDVPVAVGVQLQLEVGVEVGVQAHALRILRLEILDVDLSGHRLVAVLHRRHAFGDLYALHPCAGDIPQRIRRCRPAECRHVLREQLHVSAWQAEQLNLFGSCGGVGIVDVYRRRGGEAFTEVAACGAAEFHLPYAFGVGYPSHLSSGGCVAHDYEVVELRGSSGVGRFGGGSRGACRA